MLMKKGIPFYELLAFYLNIGMIVELLDKALLLVGLNFNYVSIVPVSYTHLLQIS